METLFRIWFFMAVMRLSAAEASKDLNGLVGGNVTFPGPVWETGLFYGFVPDRRMKILEERFERAAVNNGELEIVDDIYTNKLHWNRTSGLFTITDLQKNDSTLYIIDSEIGLMFYNVMVYDGAPTPAVETLTVSSDSCWLLCSVDKATSLLWYKEQEVQNQNSSASSLPITVHKEDRDSSYRCVAANPAENKTLHVNVTTACGFNETESGDNSDQRAYWIVAAAVMGLMMVAVLVVWRISQRKTSIRKTPENKALCLQTISLPEPELNRHCHPAESSPTSGGTRRGLTKTGDEEAREL
ncbi:uncharacterized protein LOC118563243 [Fundulus heteroclitus]|uniref:uncharacterized protein LOC118563243 n=1 Tax=Fundulus heteroclitus TaxID=8078 RepID=UPI00165C1228|nr:uncharacterized protein LOC118563243 [Fundulus heteroclitus]